MSEFNTLNIVGNSQVQLIGKNINIVKPFNSVPSIISLVLDIYNKKPADLDIPNEYVSICIINGSFTQYIPLNKTKPSYRIKSDEIQEYILNNVLTEMKS